MLFNEIAADINEERVQLLAVVYTDMAVLDSSISCFVNPCAFEEVNDRFGAGHNVANDQSNVCDCRPAGDEKALDVVSVQRLVLFSARDSAGNRVPRRG